MNNEFYFESSYRTFVHIFTITMFQIIVSVLTIAIIGIVNIIFSITQFSLLEWIVISIVEILFLFLGVRAAIKSEKIYKEATNHKDFNKF